MGKLVVAWCWIDFGGDRNPLSFGPFLGISKYGNLGRSSDFQFRNTHGVWFFNSLSRRNKSQEKSETPSHGSCGHLFPDCRVLFPHDSCNSKERNGFNFLVNYLGLSAGGDVFQTLFHRKIQNAIGHHLPDYGLVGCVFYSGFSRKDLLGNADLDRVGRDELYDWGVLLCEKRKALFPRHLAFIRFGRYSGAFCSSVSIGITRAIEYQHFKIFYCKKEFHHSVYHKFVEVSNPFFIFKSTH